jgi:TolB protein
MLVRTFRLTDKFSNALLKVAIYTAFLLLERVQGLRQAIIATLSAIVLTIWGAIRFIGQSVQALFQTAQRPLNPERQSRIRQVMVQRAEQAAIARQKDLEMGKVIEDPLLARNRSLSAVTVILLIVLIAFLIYSPNNQGNSLGSTGGIIPPAPINEVQVEIPSPTPIPPTPNQVLSNVTGTLVFSLRQSGQADIWALPVGSSQPIRLTDSPEDDHQPTWSPDGGAIAFVSRRDGFWNLYLIDLVAGETRQVTFGQRYVGHPTWSPDGQFIAFEAYDEAAGNIDIFIASRAGEVLPVKFTNSPLPDLEPSWSPNGTDIAYIGWRNGNAEVLVLNTQGQPEGEALNISNSPDSAESQPEWSPDGTRLVYASMPNGIESIYVKNLAEPEAAPRLIGRGSDPTWNPSDGASVFYTVPQGANSAIYLGQVDNFGIGANAIAFQGQVADLDWTASLHSLRGFNPGSPALYEERLVNPADSLQPLVALFNVTAPDPQLSDAVNDSFEAARRRVIDKSGVDLLGALESAFWQRNRPSEPGESRQNWHYTGRAISIPRDLVLQGNPTPIVVIREETELGTYWRVMLRVAETAQNGRLGEPLRTLPWDFGARFGEDPLAFEQGGLLMTAPPDGYYVDVTQLLADFGWERVEADRTWRANFSGVLFWQFQKTDGLTWRAAMLQIYSQQEVAEFEAGILPPAPTAIPSVLPQTPATAIPTSIIATALPTATPTGNAVTPATPLPTSTP